jgi:hypothetical protein
VNTPPDAPNVARYALPQLHVHNPVLNRVPCDIDGKWRALDSRAIHVARPAAAAALAERVMWGPEYHQDVCGVSSRHAGVGVLGRPR